MEIRRRESPRKAAPLPFYCVATTNRRLRFRRGDASSAAASTRSAPHPLSRRREPGSGRLHPRRSSIRASPRLTGRLHVFPISRSPFLSPTARSPRLPGLFYLVSVSSRTADTVFSPCFYFFFLFCTVCNRVISELPHSSIFPAADAIRIFKH